MAVRASLKVMSWIFGWLGAGLSLQSPESERVVMNPDS